MNVLTIIVLVLVALYMIRGYRNGLLKTVVASTTLLLSIILVMLFSPSVSNFLETQTTLYSLVTDRCEKIFSLEMQDDESVAVGGVKWSAQETQEKLIDQMEIPELLKKALKKNNTAQAYAELAVNNFNEYIPRYIAHIIMQMISFVITWLIVTIFLNLTVMTLGFVENIKFVKGVNQFFGMLLGLLQGLVVVWIGFLVITIISNTEVGAALLAMISESPLLEHLYDRNLILKAIQFVADKLF